MPLLKADKNGNIYEYGFGDDSKRADVTPDDGTVIYGEYDPRAKVRRDKAQQLRANKIAAQRKAKYMAQLRAAQAAAKAEAQNAQVLQAKRKLNQKLLAQQNAKYMNAAEDAILNPLASGFHGQARGDQLAGFGSAAKYVPRKQMGAHPITGVEDAGSFGNTTLQNWPAQSTFSKSRRLLRQEVNSSPRDLSAHPMGDLLSDIGNFVGGALNLLNPVSIINTIAPGLVPSWADPAQIMAAVPAALVNNYNSLANANQIAYNALLATSPASPFYFTTQQSYEQIGNQLRQADTDLKNGIQAAVNAAGAVRDAVAGALDRNKVAIAQGLTVPSSLYNDIIKQTPILKEVYWEADKLVGGKIESINRSMTIPGKVLAGKPVSNAECIEAIINGVQVGAIVLSGGSAASIISFTASSLKNGPLGATPEGRKLLAIGEMVALSEAAGESIAKIMYTKATDSVADNAGEVAGKIGGPAAQATVTSAIKAAALALITPTAVPAAATVTSAKQANALANATGAKAAENVQKSALSTATAAAKTAATEEATKQGKAIVAAEFEKKTGVPLDLAMKVATTGQVPSAAEIKAGFADALANGPDKLKEELDKLPLQLKDADAKMKQLLLSKKDALEYELNHRILNTDYIKEQAAIELQKAEDEFAAKRDEFLAQVKKLKDFEYLFSELKKNAEKMAYEEFQRQLKALTEMIEQLKAMLMKLIQELIESFFKRMRLGNDAATRVLIAEHGGATIYTPSTSGKNFYDYRHPLAVFGLLKRG